MRFHSYLILVVAVTALCSCSQRCSSPIVAGHPADTLSEVSISYAQLLQIEELKEGRTLCRITDPWGSGRPLMQYLLVPRNDSQWCDAEAERMTHDYGASVILRTPLEHIALTAGCHAWLLTELNAIDRVCVMCDTAYVMASNVKRLLRQTRSDGKGWIADGGSATSPNAEVLLHEGVDALWVSPYENSSFGQMGQLPIAVIYCAEYMEQHPLGRAEWMKFFGRLVGRAKEADQLFTRIAERYEQAVAKDTDQNPRQKLLAELPYGATWYVPGGVSTAAIVYDDAGYDYLWSKDRHAGSLSLSKEAVLAQAKDCDIWLIKYMDPDTDWSLSTLLSQQELYGQLGAVRKGNVWGCNTSRSDYFDVTPFRPDSLLESLQAMDGAFFHPLK